MFTLALVVVVETDLYFKKNKSRLQPKEKLVRGAKANSGQSDAIQALFACSACKDIFSIFEAVANMKRILLILFI